ncbi:MAG: class II glutamine amidotransferase [Alphaproteobacteria bacterium]|jgi:glutamine amidotransferase
MCRWLAYAGPPILLERLLFEAENSLIEQSLSSRMGRAVTNGDGFGIGWYGGRAIPGQYRDIFPAWNDANLRSLAEQIESPLFFAHVRASTGTSTARVNCHPFRHGPWLFMHNGQIGDYLKIRREIDHSIAPEFYPYREGSTDTEALFYLALAHGLATDPLAAITATIADVEGMMAAGDCTSAFRMTVAASDGTRIIAYRYSSDNDSPSLYTIRGKALAERIGGDDLAKQTGGDAVLVLSEPLDEDTDDWTEVPDGHMLIAQDGNITLTPIPL